MPEQTALQVVQSLVRSIARVDCGTPAICNSSTALRFKLPEYRTCSQSGNSSSPSHGGRISWSSVLSLSGAAPGAGKRMIMISSSGFSGVCPPGEIMMGPYSQTAGGGVQKHGSLPQLSPVQSACVGGLEVNWNDRTYCTTPGTRNAGVVVRSTGLVRFEAVMRRRSCGSSLRGLRWGEGVASGVLRDVAPPLRRRPGSQHSVSL